MSDLSPIPYFRLTTPCSQCPFRADSPLTLGLETVNRVLDAVAQGQPFMCHKTTTLLERSAQHEQARYCAGAMRYSLKTGQPGVHMQLGQRLGVWSPEGLKTDVSVFESEAAFRLHHDALNEAL